MAQYDVVPNPDPTTSRRAPFLIVLQHDLLGTLPTVVVAPLVRDVASNVQWLNPRIDVAGEMLCVSTAELFATRRNRLGRPVANVAHEHHKLLRATDLIFSGV